MKFDELSDKAKEKALEWAAICNAEHFDGDSVLDSWSYILIALGFYDFKIYYSGFASQGDGACFTGHWEPAWVELDKLKEWVPDNDPAKFGTFAQEQHALWKLLKAAGVEDDEGQEDTDGQLNFLAGHVRLTKNGRYYHENSIDYEYSYEGWNRILEENFEEWCKDLMKMIYRELESDYEYATSREAALELLECNEYDFNDKGEIQ